MYDDSTSLAKWVTTQRQEYSLMKKGKPSSMIADRIGGLNAIGFTWQINKYSLLWLEWYEELKQFKLQKSHCEVPRNYKENPTLGIWVNTQRNHYRLSKKDK